MRKRGTTLAALIMAYGPVFAQDNLLTQDDFYRFQDTRGEFVYSKVEEERDPIHIIDVSRLPPCKKDFCSPTQRYLDEVERREQSYSLEPQRIEFEFQDREHPEIIDTLREVSRFAIPIGAYVIDSQLNPDEDEFLEIEVMKR